MKAKLKMIILFALLLLSEQGFAGLSIGIPVPQDDIELKRSLWERADSRPQTEADFQSYFTLETSISKLSESKLLELFGPKVPMPESGFSHKVPDRDYVLPIHRPESVGFSGFGYEGDGKSYFLRIGDVGGALVFPYGREDHLSFVALYLKTDAAFIALKSLADLPARREWDKRRTSELQKFITDKLPKQ